MTNSPLLGRDVVYNNTTMRRGPLLYEPTQEANLRATLEGLRRVGKILIAILFGSYAGGTPHVRSDLDLAVYLRAKDDEEDMEIIDCILMSTEKDISILRLDDEDESPFVVQEALKGIHLVSPDLEMLYAVSHRVLHECETIRFRRDLRVGEG